MFVHLHVHSQGSILDATASVEQLARAAARNKMSALALTDHGNLHLAVDFYKACQKEGIRPIIGCEVYVAPESRHDKVKRPGKKNAYHLTLLAKNEEGYHNLCKLSSIGYLEGFYYFPRIDKEVLEKHAGGLVCLSGCMSSELAQNILTQEEEVWRSTFAWYRNLFKDDYYLEIQRHPMTDEEQERDGFFQESWLLHQYQEVLQQQEELNQTIIALSKETGVPLVATNDVHYIEREDWRAHEIVLNIQSGEPCEMWERDSMGNPKRKVPNPKRRTYSSHALYFKSAKEMQTLFSDIPEAVETTQTIAEKCTFSFDFSTKHYPVFTPPDFKGKNREEDVNQFLWNLCREQIPKRYGQPELDEVKKIYPGRDPTEVVQERLAFEMSIIGPKGMCDYLLIVWDFIHWAKQQGIPVGPGRGSGAGSIVLYLIGVFDIEPLRFNLFFERFINPERISYPDIDVDICMDRRDEVIEYTLQKYGKDNVAQIITFGTMKAKMAIKDVGRVLDVPLAKVNQIAKLIPEELGMTIDKALEIDRELRRWIENDDEVKKVVTLARKLEGSIRNTGVHAAGIIVSGEPLTHHIALATAKDQEMPITQFSMKPVEALGMLKIDFLGLKTLTAIQRCVDFLQKQKGIVIDWSKLPLNDKKTFSILNQGKTMGIFQLESGGMTDLAKQLHLDRFEEIVAVGALYRPGPMSMIPSYIARKHGKEPIEYDHPQLKEILSETYGIMVYQEQVMQIANQLANYSLGEGDVLRKAMGKKDMMQMVQQREKFKKGAFDNGIDEEIATKIFDQMERFAAYGFNKSHATAYGYLTYVTAYLKANHPAEWMAALMTCDRDDIGKVAKFIQECQTMGIPILPPDINEAGTTFVATSHGIRFALSGIKGVGGGVVEAIIEERTKKGPFLSFYEFFQRTDGKRVGKKMVEYLVDAGAFDWTQWSRGALRMSIDPMYEQAQKEQQEKSAGVLSLFSLMEETEELPFQKPPKEMEPRPRNEMLLKEKELLGFFLTGHPMDEYKEVLARLSCVSLRRLESLSDNCVIRSAFIVESVKVRFSQKSQKKFAILTISDGLVREELPVWPDLYEQKSALLIENQLLCAVLTWESRDGVQRLGCRWLQDLTQVNEEMIADCDRAYDAAKFSFKQREVAMTKKKAVVPEKEVKISSESQHLSLMIDTTRARLSHIVAIRDSFMAHAGTTPVTIAFQEGDRELAHLKMDSNEGVDASEEMVNKLQSISSVLDVRIHSKGSF